MTSVFLKQLKGTNLFKISSVWWELLEQKSLWFLWLFLADWSVSVTCYFGELIIISRRLLTVSYQCVLFIWKHFANTMEYWVSLCSCVLVSFLWLQQCNISFNPHAIHWILTLQSVFFPTSTLGCLSAFGQLLFQWQASYVPLCRNTGDPPVSKWGPSSRGQKPIATMYMNFQQFSFEYTEVERYPGICPLNFIFWGIPHSGSPWP
jgi:hypothetical protein